MGAALVFSGKTALRTCGMVNGIDSTTAMAAAAQIQGWYRLAVGGSEISNVAGPRPTASVSAAIIWPVLLYRFAGSGFAAVSTTRANGSGRSARTSSRVWRGPDSIAHFIAWKVGPHARDL